MSHTAVIILLFLFMLPCLAGVFLPIFPGVPIMLLLAAGFGFWDSWQHLSANEFIVLALITMLTIVIDYASGLIGARWGGASRTATLAGIGGMIVGMLVAPPFGGFIGLFLAIFFVEYRTGVYQRALKAATGSVIGTLSGIAVNGVLGVLFLILFLLFAWR